MYGDGHDADAIRERRRRIRSLRWELFCLKFRYLFRDPYDLEYSRLLAAEIERTDTRLKQVLRLPH